MKRRFGARLRELREAAGLGVREMAQIMEWSAPYQSEIEHGKRYPPSAWKLQKLAWNLGADPEELIQLSMLEKRRVALQLTHTNREKDKIAVRLAQMWEQLTTDQLERIRQIVEKEGDWCVVSLGGDSSRTGW